MYRRIGGIIFGDDQGIPESVEEIGYELYPRNGDQMWEAYKKYSARHNIDYDDTFIRDTI